MSRNTCQRCEEGTDHNFEHGCSSGYSYHRCRCDDCREWRGDRGRKEMEDPKARMRQREYLRGRYHSDPEFRARRANAMARYNASPLGIETSRTSRRSRRSMSTPYRDAVKRVSEEAVRFGRFDEEELDLVSASMRGEISTLETAILLGRTYQSIATKKMKIRKRQNCD